MKTAFLIAIISTQLIPAYAQDPAISKVIQEFHDRNEFDGVVVLSQNGKVLVSSAAGYADRAAKIAITPETVFRLASLTKQVTALLVMQEVSAHRIDLDRKTAAYLTPLPESTGRVTIRQLLQHVSGLPNPSDGPDDVVPPFYTRTDPSATDMRKTAFSFCSGAPKRAPGERFEYNNCDYIVLGAVLESVTGKTYPELIKTRVIEPLGLRSWGIFPADPKTAPLTALAYRENGMPDLPQNPATYGSSGALYGNAVDVAKWNDALLTHKLLSPEATELMFHADPKLYGEALGSWAYDSPVTTPPLHIVERQGDIGSTRLLSLLFPQRNASLIIIANTERADLFNTYSRKGLGYAILEAWVK